MTYSNLSNDSKRIILPPDLWRWTLQDFPIHVCMYDLPAGHENGNSDPRLSRTWESWAEGGLLNAGR